MSLKPVYEKLEHIANLSSTLDKREFLTKIAREEINNNFTEYKYESKGNDDRSKFADSVKIHLNGKDLVNEVKNFNLSEENPKEGRQALTKKIPLELLNVLSEDCLWGILTGLIDGDGCCVKNTAMKKPRYSFRLSTSSEGLLKSTKELAYRLGIKVSVTTTPPRNGSNTAYTITFSNVDIYKRSKGFLNFVGEREQKYYNEFMSSDFKCVNSKEYLPLCNEEVCFLKNVMPKSTRRNTIVTALNKSKDKPKLDLYRAQDMLEWLQDFKEYPEYKSLYQRAHSEVRWEMVQSVEDAGNRKVFDFCVATTKIFATGNGLIIWDTLVAHVPVSEAAVKEAREKMMPQQNLFATRDHDLHYKPTQEFIWGSYFATKKPKEGLARTFDSEAEAISAYKRGELSIDSPVKINPKQVRLY